MVQQRLIAVPKQALHIAVFCKPPVPGQVKTRLIPAYGAQGAAHIYAQLVERTLSTVRAARTALDASASLWVAGSVTHPSIKDWADRNALPIYAQCAGDLGDKMLHTLTTMACDHERVLLIGTDCPALTIRDLQAAAVALTATCHWVFTPTEDGGYVLVGSNTPAPEAFANITWSTPQVLVQTRDALRANALAWVETNTLWDVDEAPDVERARAAMLIDI